VLAQSEPDFELWVIDDGSRDATPELVSAIREPRLHYVRSEINRGGNFARNEGLRRSSAPIVCFLDSDDRYLPGKLRFVLEYFDERPFADVLVDSFRVANGRGREKIRRNPAVEDPASLRRLVFDRTIFKATPAISARRAALLEVGLFDETLQRRQDMDLLLRLTRRHVCHASDRVTWVKHVSPDRISGRADTFLAAAIEICERHPEYLSEHNAGLFGDLSRHFRRLLLLGHWRLFARDARRYHAYGAFGIPLSRLMLTSRNRYRARSGSYARVSADHTPPIATSS
jgi:glycosyltransferase involved in cell wall biosynthesis